MPPKWVPKLPILVPNRSKMDQKWVQNGQDGSQNDHGGAKMAHPGLEHDFLAPGIQKDSPKWRSKWSKNRPKNYSKKRLFFEAGSDAIFVCVLPISIPKWCQNGARWAPKSTQKPLPVEKAGFRSHTAKQMVSEGSAGFGASILETPSDHKSMKNRCPRPITIFDRFFPLVVRFGVHFGAKNPTPEPHFRDLFGVPKKRV